MNKKENFQAFVNHEPVEWIPSMCINGDPAWVGNDFEYWENGPIGGGYDGFGNKWVPTESSGGQGALDPTVIPLDDVCDWEDKVVFPDLDAIDWEKYAEEQLAGIDRATTYIEYHTWNSVYLRFAHLLGFENALCAFYEEPEASKALCDAIGDYKVRLIERIAKYLNPDALVHYDDVATERGLFMSPETYREFIKPAHTRMNEAARALGMDPEIHICGYCTDIIPDIIEEGSMVWQAAQPMNDIAAIIREYGDRIGVFGGYDTNGKPAMPDVTEDQVTSEVDRCIDEYGQFGRSFAFLGYIMGDFNDPDLLHKYDVMESHFAERCKDFPRIG